MYMQKGNCIPMKEMSELQTGKLLKPANHKQLDTGAYTGNWGRLKLRTPFPSCSYTNGSSLLPTTTTGTLECRCWVLNLAVAMTTDAIITNKTGPLRHGFDCGVWVRERGRERIVQQLGILCHHRSCAGGHHLWYRAGLPAKLLRQGWKMIQMKMQFILFKQLKYYNVNLEMSSTVLFSQKLLY